MPKCQTSLSIKLHDIVKKNLGTLKTDGAALICVICECQITFDHKHGTDRVHQHFNSATHKHLLSVKDNKQKQSMLLESFGRGNTSEVNQYYVDLTKCLIESDIPFNKLRNKSFSTFLENYTNKKTPDSTTLRKGYVEPIFNETMQRMRNIVSEHSIYLIVDETTDSCSRYVLNVLVGALNGKYCKPMLILTKFIDQTNNITVSQGIMDACSRIWPNQIRYDKLVLIVTDAAAYMIKCMNNLKGLFPNLHHITCLAHMLHRVCETIRDENKHVDKFIALMKEILVKSPQRQQLYKEVTNLALPPKPVITRWGTWLTAAQYYATNFTAVCNFLNILQDKSAAISNAKNIISTGCDEMRQLLQNVSKLHFLCYAITSLEESGLTVLRQMEIVREVQTKLEGNALIKIEKCISKNPDLLKFIDQNNINDHLVSCEYAPLVSVDVERSFSTYKVILADNRQTMGTETIEYFNVILFNK